MDRRCSPDPETDSLDSDALGNPFLYFTHGPVRLHAYLSSALPYRDDEQRGGDGFGGGECEPDAGHAEEPCHEEGAEDDRYDATDDRDEEGPHRGFGRGEVARADDVRAGEEVAEEVEPHALHAEPRHVRVLLAVEDLHDLYREEVEHEQKEEREHERREHREPQRLADLLRHPPAVEVTEERLRTLRDTAEDRRFHEGNVADHTEGGDADRACQREDQEIEDHHRHTRGDVPDERGGPELRGLQDHAPGCLPVRHLNRTLLRKHMRSADRTAHDRRDAGSERGTRDAELHREHEDVVEDDVKDTTQKHSHHRSPWRTVVPGEGAHTAVQHKEWRKHHEDPGIRDAHCSDLRIRTEELQDLGYAEKSEQHERDTADQRPYDGIREVAVRLVLSARTADREARRRAHRKHIAEGEDQIVEREHQVQRRHTGRPTRDGDEKGVHQDVGRHADLTDDIRRYVFCKERRDTRRPRVVLIHKNLTIHYYVTMGTRRAGSPI